MMCSCLVTNWLSTLVMLCFDGGLLVLVFWSTVLTLDVTVSFVQWITGLNNFVLLG